MEKHKADYTAVVREEGEIHILKAKIISDTKLWFQMHNRTTGAFTPVMEIEADFGMLKMVDQKKYGKTDVLQKETKYVNRQRLVGYFKHLQLQALISQL